MEDKNIIGSVISLINSDGYNMLLKPFIEEQIESAKEALIYAEGQTTEEEMFRVYSLRSIINVYRGLLEQINSWVADLNEEKDDKEKGYELNG